MKKNTQERQVVEALRKQGGYATLRRLNEIIDFSSWKTRTPEASVRRIVQKSSEIFRIQPGLWALEDSKQEVLNKFKIQVGNIRGQEEFSHSYYQGLLVEMGRFLSKRTYVPPQDKHRMFLDKQLGDISDIESLPSFTYESIMRKARTVDVIWFNDRNMPTDFYEIEHTTDIKNSLTKFYELQDFYSHFFIVADKHREAEYKDKITASIFSNIKSRVRFLDYEWVSNRHSCLSKQDKYKW